MRSRSLTASPYPTKRRYWQYEVTDVGGDMEGRIEVGAITLDYWQGPSHTYTIFNMETLEPTGWYSVRKIAEATPEQYESLVEAGR